MNYQVAVDLGGTFTAAAICRSGQAEVIPIGPHAIYLPSAHVNPDGSLIPGEAARFAAFVVGSVAGMMGGPPARVALTYPAGWDRHRLATLHTALVAHGLGGVVLLSGAQAAAHAYAERVPVSPGELIAVYDLGGTHFDATVVRRLDDGTFEPASRTEELAVGGFAFDQLVFDHVRHALGERFAALDPADPAVRQALDRLRHQCVLAKEALSTDTEARVPVALPGIDAGVRLSHTEFDKLARPMVEETAAALARAIEAAGSTPADVSAVLLTGGSVRVPLVAQVVSEVLGRPVTAAANPKADTAIGAALAVGGPNLDTSGVTVAVPVEPVLPIEPVDAGVTQFIAPAAPAPALVSTPAPVGPPAPVTAARRFRLTRTVAAAAAALVVGAGVLFATHHGPSAGGHPKPAGSTGSTGQTVTTTTEPTTNKKPASTPRQAPEPDPTRNEQPRSAEPPARTDPDAKNTTPADTTTTSTDPGDTTTTTTTTTTTSPENPEEPPANPPAELGQAERPQP
jgi:molecular chaperone DnaK